LERKVIKKALKKNLPILCLVAAVFGVLAVIFCCLQAYVITSTTVFASGSSTTAYSLFNLMFGCDATYNSDTKSNQPTVGLIIAFVLLIVGILGSVAAAYFANGKKKENVASIAGLCAAVLLIAGGIMFFFTLKMAGLETGTVDLYIAKGTASAGAGIYLAGICGILGGLLDLPVAVAPFIK
jgi:DMSO reductase anchor subunit